MNIHKRVRERRKARARREDSENNLLNMTVLSFQELLFHRDF